MYTTFTDCVKHFSGRAFQKGSMWHPDDTGVTYTLSLGHTQVVLDISFTETTQEPKPAKPETTQEMKLFIPVAFPTMNWNELISPLWIFSRLFVPVLSGQ